MDYYYYVFLQIMVSVITSVLTAYIVNDNFNSPE